MDYCTLFDSSFLARGVAMLRSLRRCAPQAQITVLCMDETCERLLRALDLPGVQLLALADFINADLQRARATRSWQEFCWTCTASLIEHVMTRAAAPLLTYVDADLLFFAAPDPVFREMGDSSVLLIPHRYPPRLSALERRGIYNVQFMPFRNDAAGREALAWWRAATLEWCYNRDEPGRFGDQKYLDDWPTRFSGVHVLRHHGAGVAPWNYEQYEFGSRGEEIVVSGAPLIFYHFSQFRMCSNGRVRRIGHPYEAVRPAPDLVYSKYEQAIREAFVEIRRVAPEFCLGLESYPRLLVRETLRRFTPYRLKQLHKKHLG